MRLEWRTYDDTIKAYMSIGGEVRDGHDKTHSLLMSNALTLVSNLESQVR